MTVSPTAVYLIKNTWSEANYKVGITANIPRRIAEIEDQYGVDASLVYACWLPTKESAQRAEHYWHKHFSEYWTDDHPGKEWFSLASTNLMKYRDWCSKSPSKHNLLSALYKQGMSLKKIREFSTDLLKSIPMKEFPVSIDVWRSPFYSLNANDYNKEPNHFPG